MVKSYSEAATRQQNWERQQGYSCQYPGADWPSAEDHARESLKAQLYDFQHQYPDAGYDSLSRKLYQWAWIEEMDEIFEEELGWVVDEIVYREVVEK